MLPRIFNFDRNERKDGVMATVKFFLQSKKNPANIYLNLSIRRGLILRRKTGYVINPNDWSVSTNLPKQNDADLKILKAGLVSMSIEVEKRLNDAVASGVDITGEWLEDQIDTINGKKKPSDIDRLVNYCQYYIESLPYKEYPSGKKGVANSTVLKYKTLKRKLQEFEEYQKKTFYVKDVDLKFRNDIVKYFSEIDKLNGNSTGRYVKFIKTVCLDAKKNGIEVNQQLDHIKGFVEKAPKIFLTFEELDRIEKAEYTREALNNARDWLIIGCYVGQRVSDLLKLSGNNLKPVRDIKTGRERVFIELTQKKTGKRVAIPVHPKVQTILDKRDGKFPVKISDQKFNLHLKDVCSFAGITYLVEGNKMNKDTHRKVKGVYPKSELITSHVCRRSFATNFYGLIPTAQLKSVTAHSTEKQFLEYIGKTETDYAMMLADSWDRLGR